MNHSNNSENLEDARALRRERKKRPGMKQHGQALKHIATSRSAEHIHKIVKKKR